MPAERFPGVRDRHFAHSFQVADGAVQMDVNKMLYPFYSISQMPQVTLTVTEMRFVGSSSQVDCNTQ